MDKKLVIFDFDGVITDSYDVCIKVSRHFEENLTDEAYKTLFTGNVYEALEKGRDAKLVVKNSNNDLYFEIYEPLIMEVPPRKGFKELIKELHKKGIKIAFVSSCYNKPLTNYLIKYGIKNYVDEILGGDIEKSKVKKFLMLFNQFNINPNEALFITDTLGDLIEAEKAGLESIAVTFGFHDRKTLEKGKSLKIFDTVEEMNEFLGSALGASTSLVESIPSNHS